MFNLRKLSFMEAKWVFIGLSLVITLAGLISMGVRGLNYGLDFQSGTRIDITFDHQMNTSDVRGALTGLGHGDAKVQVVGTDKHEVVIVTRSLSTEDRRAMQSGLEAKLGKFDVLSMDDVGPEFSKELVNATVMAVILASVGMLIYITIRFEYRFATAGIIALLHDALILTGVFSLIGKEINIPFVAALLTMLGYSINDTIVVYDRIRENLRNRKKNEDLEGIVDRSIGEVIWRSVGTSITTLLAIGAVYVFGGPTTKDFALALLIGITSGTYSSIFIASPIWVLWRNADERKKLQAKAAAKSKDTAATTGKPSAGASKKASAKAAKSAKSAAK
ncbi:MAG: protein translocase subunit SecF [Bacillota bacterium]